MEDEGGCLPDRVIEVQGTVVAILGLHGIIQVSVPVPVRVRYVPVTFYVHRCSGYHPPVPCSVADPNPGFWLNPDPGF
jgi:hypothetical protein